jgi:CrcB protein
MLSYIWVGLGGAIGSAVRFWASGVVARHFGETFPWGTHILNVSGSFLIGAFASATGQDGRWLAPPSMRQFSMLGICGGYTTFSSSSLQTLNLARDGEWFDAGANTVLSVVLCLIGVWAGHLVAGSLNPAKGT